MPPLCIVSTTTINAELRNISSAYLLTRVILFARLRSRVLYQVGRERAKTDCGSVVVVIVEQVIARRDDMPPAERGGSTSVRVRIRSPHSLVACRAAWTDRQTDRRTDGSRHCLMLPLPYSGAHNQWRNYNFFGPRQCSGIRIFSFFQISKKHDFLRVFLK